jgi:hypothetical protein
MGVYKLSTAGGLATPRTNYSSFLAGNPAFVDTSYESISTVSVSTAVSSISFTSIPATYKHLQLRMILRSTDAGGNAGPILRMNSDSASNYNYHILEGTASGGSANATFLTFGNCPAGGTTAGTFGAFNIDILDYADTNKFKTTRSLFGYDYSAGPYGLIDFTSGTWRSTSAISTISLTMFTGSNFAQYSHAALYGIKGA